jgi:hypothetical protein
MAVQGSKSSGLEIYSKKETAMKLAFRRSFVGVTAVAMVAIPAHLIAQRPQHKGFAHYNVTDLGTLDGAYSFGLGLNNAGVVAGAAATATQNGDPTSVNPPPPQTAFLWSRGHIMSLGTLGAPDLNLNSAAGGPNRFKQAAVESETAKLDPNGEDFCYFGTHRQCLGAIWKNGKLTPLSTMGANNTAALGINDLGQIVGFAETTDYDASCKTPAKPYQTYRFQAVIWESNGHIRHLRPYPGDTVSFGFGINNFGQAVGGSGLCSNTDMPPVPMGPRSVLWERDGSRLTSAASEASSAFQAQSAIGVTWTERPQIKAAISALIFGRRNGERCATSARCTPMILS